MTKVPYRSYISFERLVNDCWEVLQTKRSVSFPLGGRAAPSLVVFVFPKFDLGYDWSFWDVVVAPTLISLSETPPPYEGGWNNPTSRTTVEASLSAAIASSAWALKVDYTA